MQRGLGLLLLIATTVVLLTVTADAAESPSLFDSIQSTFKRPSTVSTSSTSYYEGPHVAKDTACFDTPNTCVVQPTLIRSPLTCCTQDEGHRERPHYGEGHDQLTGGDQLMGQVTHATVGTCTLLLTAPFDYITITRNLVQAAPALLSCTLFEEADSCGLGCGDLTLTGQLDRYITNYVVIEGDTTSIVPGLDLPSCPTGEESDSRINSTTNLKEEALARAARAGVPKEILKKLTKARSPKASADGDITLGVGVTVVSGPVTVASKRRETKWVQGWVEYISALAFESVSVEELAEREARLKTKFPRVDARTLNKYNFQLNKDRDHYHD